jgi:hypothetical protein
MEQVILGSRYIELEYDKSPDDLPLGKISRKYTKTCQNCGIFITRGKRDEKIDECPYCNSLELKEAD